MRLLRTEDSGEHVTVQLDGQLDASSRSDVQSALFDLCEHTDVTIDLSRTRFADLGSVGMLDGCRDRARSAGRTVEIRGGPTHVTRMLEMLSRGPRWRPQKRLTTTTDEQRSGPDSEQIVRVQCRGCGYFTFVPEGSAHGACPECRGAMEAVAVFRDRRRADTPVDYEGRGTYRDD